MKLVRHVVAKTALHQHEDDNYVPGSMEERVLMVWPITRKVLALSPQYDAEQRLQRHVVCVARRQR